MGDVRDEEERRRELWVLVATLTMSRDMLVWPTFAQTLVALCEGLEAAWRFFGGVVHRFVPDNMSAVVVRADAKEPVLARAFVEYAPARGFFANLRELCESAKRWCREVAGARVPGTTRRVPHEVFEAEELPHLSAVPEVPFDVPTWTRAKVRPDHGEQVARSLYYRADALLRLLRQSRLDSSRDALMTELCTVDVLILDDFALEPMTRDESRDVYQLFVERTARASTIVTSNRDTSDWLAVFDDTLLAQSAIDRFQNNAYDLVIDGESYRSRLKPNVERDGPPPAAPAGRQGFEPGHFGTSPGRIPHSRKSRLVSMRKLEPPGFLSA
jgi:hypothetical protein